MVREDESQIQRREGKEKRKKKQEKQRWGRGKQVTEVGRHSACDDPLRSGSVRAHWKKGLKI